LEEANNSFRLRLTLAGIGALSGLFFWLLFDVLPDQIENKRFIMLLAAFAGSFFGSLLLMVGRLTPLIAARYAGVIAAVPSLLFFWASYRFVDISGFFESIHPVFAVFFLAHLPLPFVLAQEGAAQSWRDYEGLFDHAWSIFVRMITAWSFTGLFWMVLFLSDQLLELVGFEYLGILVEEPVVAMPLTGLVLGLALAVLNELRHVVSILRRLALQLLRLLLPMVTLVVALFILLVPFQGLDQVFGSLSAAGTMLAMAAGAVTLITSSVDARDTDATHSKIMVISAKALSGLLPIIALIAVYAIWVRVAQYGWTPARLAAVVISGIVLAYALAYASSLLMGTAWRARIRQSNTWLAVSVIAVSGLWLSPVLNVERISANSHAARFLEGKIAVQDLDVWGLGAEWGKAGTAALAGIRALENHSEQSALDKRIARFDDGEGRWALRNNPGPDRTQSIKEELVVLMPIRPNGQKMPDGLFDKVPLWALKAMVKSCEDVLPDGRVGCAIVRGSFDRGGKDDAAILFWRHDNVARTEIAIIERRNSGAQFTYQKSIISLGGEAEEMPAEELISRVLDGDFAFEPVRLDALQIGEIQILPRKY
jgi:hypothetical protein